MKMSYIYFLILSNGKVYHIAKHKNSQNYTPNCIHFACLLFFLPHLNSRVRVDMSHFPFFQLAGRNFKRMIAFDEFFGCISTRSLKYLLHSSRVNINQFCYIVDIVLDYYPNVILGIVFSHILPTIKYLFSIFYFLFDLHMFLCFAKHIFTMIL